MAPRRTLPAGQAYVPVVAAAMPVALAPAPAQSPISMAAAPPATQPARAPTTASAAPPVRTPAPKVIAEPAPKVIAEPAAVQMPPSKTVTPTSARNDREKKRDTLIKHCGDKTVHWRTAWRFEGVTAPYQEHRATGSSFEDIYL